MSLFQGITHLIRNPAGSISYVGAVPVALGCNPDPRPDVNTAIRDARAVGAKLCNFPDCACRTLFTEKNL